VIQFEKTAFQVQVPDQIDERTNNVKELRLGVMSEVK
jgi:hypothetical protein